MWGSDATKNFFSLIPDRVLDAVESQGVHATGRCQALGSYENRVYDVEIESNGPRPVFKIAKFYRPGRWTREQILEEHEFLKELQSYEIPVVAPEEFEGGGTLREMEGILYTIFPRVGGRSPDELEDSGLRRLGRWMGRIHAVGRTKPFQHRLKLTPKTYGTQHLEYLLGEGHIPLHYRSRYERAVKEAVGILTESSLAWGESDLIRIHGDAHLGNVLWGPEGMRLVDFDDTLMGPVVQDFWLFLGADPRSRLPVFLEGYEEFSSFDIRQIRWIEALRLLRFVHYTAWVARRWTDPSFPRAFPHFGTESYWAESTDDLERQLRKIQTDFETTQFHAQ